MKPKQYIPTKKGFYWITENAKNHQYTADEMELSNDEVEQLIQDHIALDRRDKK